MELVQKDTTSKIVEVFLRDSTTGQGKTGVAAGSMSGDYTDPNGTATALSFSPGSVGDSYSVGKWAEAGGGKYYFHAPNGMFDSFGTVCARFSASGAIDAKREYQIVAFDPNAVTNLGLSNLDAAVTTRSSHTAANVSTQIQSDLATEIGRLDAAISSRSSHTAAGAATAVRSELTTELGRIDENVSAAKTLTSGERSTLAGVLDLALINQGDGANLIGALADAIAADWVAGDASPLAIAEAVRTELTTELARIDAAISTRSSHTAANVSDQIQSDLATELGRLDAAVTSRSSQSDMDAVKAKTDQLAFTSGLLQVVVHDLIAAALAKFASTDTGESTAVSQSVAALSQSGAGSVTVGDIDTAALAKFATVDTGETTPVAGSVAKLSANAAGGDASSANQDTIIDGVNDLITNTNPNTLAAAIASTLATLVVRRASSADVLSTDVQVVRGTTWTITLSTDVPDDWLTIEFTARDVDKTTQAESLCHVILTNPTAGTDGLQIWNESDDGLTLTDASIAVADGVATLTVKPAVTDSAPVGLKIDYDAKITSTADGTTQPKRGRLIILGNVTL